MTAPVPPDRRVYAPIEQIIGDHDPDRRICRHYTGAVLFADDTALGTVSCRADVVYADVALDLGEWVKALPCLHRAPPCPLRELGPRRCERRARDEGGQAGDHEQHQGQGGPTP